MAGDYSLYIYVHELCATNISGVVTRVAPLISPMQYNTIFKCCGTIIFKLIFIIVKLIVHIGYAFIIMMIVAICTCDESFLCVHVVCHALAGIHVEVSIFSTCFLKNKLNCMLWQLLPVH